MSKLHKGLFISIFILLIVAIGFGFATRFSYKNPDIDAAVYPEENRIAASEVLKKLDTNKILKQIKKKENVFVVTVKSQERSYLLTKTIATVHQVLKGNAELIDKKIVIYEPNYFAYQWNTKTFIYCSMNYINNIMQPNKQYLVFLDSINYDVHFQQTLDIPEYLIDIELSLYSFPINERINPIVTNGILTFKDIEGYPFLCFTNDDAKKLNEITDYILSEYLSKSRQ